jgi:hypothetical protein
MKLRTHLPRLVAALLLSILVVVTSDPSPAAAQATTVTTNETLPFTGSATNPCNGDAITFSGQIHITNHVTTSSSGGNHIRMHVNYQGVSGTGTPSGANYNVVTSQNETRNDNVGPQTETTITQVINLIAQGAVPNSKLHVVLHVTVNANGVTTSEVEEITVACKGGQS